MIFSIRIPVHLKYSVSIHGNKLKKMVYFKVHLVLPLCYCIALLSVTANPEPKKKEEYSDESSSASDGEDESKDASGNTFGILDTVKNIFIGDNATGDTSIIASSSISDERPVEDYVMLREKEIRNQRSILRSSCSSKIQRFCVKACRKTYKDVCYRYTCRSSVRDTFRYACKANCKSEYYDFNNDSDKAIWIPWTEHNNNDPSIWVPWPEHYVIPYRAQNRTVKEKVSNESVESN